MVDKWIRLTKWILEVVDLVKNDVAKTKNMLCFYSSVNMGSTVYQKNGCNLTARKPWKVPLVFATRSFTANKSVSGMNRKTLGSAQLHKSV